MMLFSYFTPSSTRPLATGMKPRAGLEEKPENKNNPPAFFPSVVNRSAAHVQFITTVDGTACKYTRNYAYV